VLEADIVKKIRAYLKSVPGLWFFKEHGGAYGQGGIPDIIVCHGGKFIALEVKTESGKLSALQNAAIRQIRAAGGIAETVRSVADVQAVITANGEKL
jgi:hypothetical protein